MALGTKTAFLYGYSVTAANNAIDFQNASSGQVLTAIIPNGYYSLNFLTQTIVTALQTADPGNAYSCNAIRSIGSNLVTIGTTGSYLKLLFASGTNALTSIAPLIGFPSTDQAGSLTYQGTSSTGTYMYPNNGENIYPYNFLDPTFNPKVIGQLNISTSGQKEEVIFNVQNFWTIEFQHVRASAYASDWIPLITWLIQARLIEFIPNVNAPTIYYESTLETSKADSKGMSMMFEEMIPEFPNHYKSGPLQFRQRLST